MHFTLKTTFLFFLASTIVALTGSSVLPHSWTIKLPDGREVPVIHTHMSQGGHCTIENANPQSNHGFPPCHFICKPSERYTDWLKKICSKIKLHLDNKEIFEKKKAMQMKGYYPTWKFNCVNYAITKPYGDNANFGCWVDTTTATGEIIMWLYIQLRDDEPKRPCDVLFFEGRHVAHIVEVDQQGKPIWCESKWGSWGMYRHTPDALEKIYGRPIMAGRRVR